MIRFALLVAFVSSAAALADDAAGVAWSVPQGWKTAPARQMRVATYNVPATKGDPDLGECGVFYFGPGQGGSVDANVQRWVGQFEQPDGKPSDAVAKKSTDKVAGMNVTRVEVTGTFTGMGGPMSPVPVKHPAFKLLGAIVEAPQGPVFFKLTGPVKTVDAARGAFEKLIKGVHPK